MKESININTMISVFLPTFNCEKYIRETLESVLNQSYKEIEVLCVDDGSSDSTVSILQGYAEKDPRVKVFQKKNDGTVPYSWNFVFPHLKGEFTIYLSHDDILAEDLLERLLAKQKESDADAVIPTVVFFEENYEKPEEKYLHKNHLYRMAGMKSMTGAEAFGRMIDYAIPGFALWRTELIRGIGMPTESFNSDELMQRIWISKCKSVEFSGAKFYYRQNQDSITKGLKPYHYGSLLSQKHLLEVVIDDCPEGYIYPFTRSKKSLQLEYFGNLFNLKTQYRLNKNNYSDEERKAVSKIFKDVYPVLSKGLKTSSIVYWFASKGNMFFNLLTWIYSKK